MATKKNIPEVVNAIRQSDKILLDALPKATPENVSEWAQPILTYQPVANAFMDALVNKLYMQMLEIKRFRNPLAILKKGTAPLGATVEDVHVNPAEATAYNPTATSLLQQHAPDSASCYYSMNRQDVYPLTVERADLRQAVTSWEALGNLIDANVNALYSGAYIDEFELMLSMFNGALGNDAIVPQAITAPTDAATAKTMVEKMRALNRKFQLPGTKYNAYAQLDQSKPARKTWCYPEDIVIVISADTEALVSVEVLAAAFNIDKAQFVANNILVIDSFGENSPIQAIMMDRSYIKVLDNLFLAEPFRNPQTLSTTYFLHVWQTYGVSPFANAVALVSSTGTYTLTTEQPADWAANYTAYYTKAGTVYPVYTAVPEGEAAPTWKANTYYSKA